MLARRYGSPIVRQILSWGRLLSHIQSIGQAVGRSRDLDKPSQGQSKVGVSGRLGLSNPKSRQGTNILPLGGPGDISTWGPMGFRKIPTQRPFNANGSKTLRSRRIWQPGSISRRSITVLLTSLVGALQD